LKHIGHQAFCSKHPNPGFYNRSERFSDALNKASKNWAGWRAIHEALRQVAESPLDRQQPPQPASPTISERLDEATVDEGISHEEQAHRIGISRTVYFEVKAGRGGRKSRRKTENYLSRIFNKIDRKSGLNRD